MSSSRPTLRRPVASLLAAGVVVLSAATVPPAWAQIPAFSGAEGFGGYATGGRGGDVYTVTNLNSSGAGSFADAIGTVPSAGRTIVFAVSGYIHITSGKELRLTASKVTIAGQTAPGDGIAFKDGTFRISGDDVILRHVRFRFRKQSSGGDCMDLDSGSLNSVLDHISLEFSSDENISSFGSPPENLTMQWALNAWGLESHSCGGLWDQNHATCHHSLWAHNHTRNPKARPNGLLDWVNNVTFDWDIGFIMGDSDTLAGWKANVRNSYFLSPAGNIRTKALEKANLDRNGTPNFSLYLNNCRHDSNGDGLLNGTDKGYGIASGSYITLATPVAATGAVPVTMDDPTVAFKKVVSAAGALRLDIDPAKPLRDEVDTILINDLVNQTHRHVSNESQTGASNGGIGTLASTTAPVDSDKDGMPDYYETALGWNVAAQDHNTALPNAGGVLTGTTYFPTGTVAGYTRLEEYLQYLAMPHGLVAKNVSGSPSSAGVDLRKFTSGFSATPVFTIANAVGGTVAQSGTGGYQATFTPTLNYTGRARFDFTVTDSAGHSWTQTCALVVSNTGLPRDIKWKGSSSAWDTATLDWLQTSNSTTVAFSSGDSVTLDDSGLAQPAVAVTGALAPGSVLVDSAGNYTLGGAGSVASNGTLTKRGAGTLTLTHTETYTGGASVEEGTLTIGAGGNLSGGAISLLDGTVFNNGYAAGNTLSLGAGFDVPAGQTATLNSGNRLTINGAFTGSGTLNYLAQTTVNRCDLSGPAAAFAGNLNFTNTGAAGAGTRLFFNGGAFNGFDAATVDLGGSVSLQPQTNSGGNTLNIGALSGSSTAANLSGGSAGTVAYVIGAKDLSTSFAGTITGNATLTKVGAGTLTLTGANTYTGTTTLSEGALANNGSLTSALTAASGTTLRGTGTFAGSVTTQTGAEVSPGAADGQIGTLTAANGFTATSTNFTFDLSSSPAGANDKISITGGTGLVSGTNNFDIRFANGVLGAGNYRLIEAAAGIPLGIGGGMVMNLTTDAPTGTRQAFTLNRTGSGTQGGYIQLIVTGTAANLVWSGTLNGATWDLNTTANFTGATPGTFYNFDNVTLDDTSANRSVALTGSLQPRALTVNTTAGYTITGAGTLDGTGALTKSGTGSLTMTGAHTFTGGTTLNAGTLQLANAAANAGGLGAGPVTLNGGTLAMYSAGDATYAGALPNTLNVAGTATFQAAPRGGFSGGVTGGGTLNYYTTFVRSDLTGDWSTFTGTVNVISDAGGGDYRIAASYFWPGLPLATVNLTANMSFYFAGISNAGAGTTIPIGELSGPANSHLRGGVTGGRNFTYRIGGKTPFGSEVIFAGDIAEQNTGTTSSYVKTGAGTWTLSGPCAWNGGTTVEQGTLRLTGSVACGAATNVASGATLNLAGGSLATEALNIAGGANFTTSGTVTTNGDFNNQGAALINGGSLTIAGDVVNTGTMRITNSASLSAGGAFVNLGVLDLLSSPSALPPNLDNQGVVIENSARRVLSTARAGSSFTVTVQGYAGHIYQLQQAPSVTGPWTSVTSPSSPQTGAGNLLSLTDPSSATGSQHFYRVSVTP